VRRTERAVDRRGGSQPADIFDSSSVEVFVNDGEACLSSRIYPQAAHRELALFAWSGRRH
jgi:sucrose-6-phosphate hydrolase SacC (GH32 family)